MPKGSPLALTLLDEIVSNVEKEIYPENDLDVTGPGLHGKVLSKILGVQEFNEGFLDYSTDGKTESVLFLKHQKHHNRKSEFEYHISLNRNIVFLCRYQNYRNDINSICKLEHYSIMFKNRAIYHETVAQIEEETVVQNVL